MKICQFYRKHKIKPYKKFAKQTMKDIIEFENHSRKQTQKSEDDY